MRDRRQVDSALLIEKPQVEIQEADEPDPVIRDATRRAIEAPGTVTFPSRLLDC